MVIDLEALTRIDRLGLGPDAQVFLVRDPRGRLLVLQLRHRLVPPGPTAADARAAIDARLAPLVGDGWRDGLLPIAGTGWFDSLPDQYLGAGGPALADGQPDDRGTLALLVPYVNGESLSRILGRGPLPAGAVAGLLAKLGRALLDLHGQVPPLAHGAIAADNVRAYGGGGVALGQPRLAPGATLAGDWRDLAELGRRALSPGTEGPQPPSATLSEAERAAAAELSALLEPLATDPGAGKSLAGPPLIARLDDLRERLEGSAHAPLRGRVVSRGPASSPPRRPPARPAPVKGPEWGTQLRAAATTALSQRGEAWQRRSPPSRRDLLITLLLPLGMAAILLVALRLAGVWPPR